MGDKPDPREAIDPLADYYKHLTTVSTGAIVVVGALAADFRTFRGPTEIASLAIFMLGACVVTSTLMIWCYGVAHREISRELGVTEAAWAFKVGKPSKFFARIIVIIGPTLAPLSFIAGLGLLAWYGIQVLN